VAGSRKKTGDVLAAIRRDLKAQLKLVRGQLADLGRDERALTKALASLRGEGPRSSSAARDRFTRRRGATSVKATLGTQDEQQAPSPFTQRDEVDRRAP
jgi:hypothetical protein